MKTLTLKILCLITLILLSASINLFSQHINLTGIIVDEKTDEPLEFVNVLLLKQDSSFVKGCISGENGKFIFTNVVPGDYLLSFSFLGYQNSIIRLDNLSASVDLDKIYIQQELQLLNEVVVQASRRIDKVDRQIILPTSIQIKSSNSGFELLNSLMIHGLRVDPVQNNISSIGGGTVQVRINNVIASTTQVKAIRPSNVLRVEYIDDPGVRYGSDEINAVINFIVKQMESGVSININLQNAPFVGFANDLFSLRASHKKSEFGFDYYVGWRDYKKRYSNIEEIFLYPSTEVKRSMNGIEQPFGYLNHSLEASYNLTESDKYVFHAVFKDNIYNSPNNDFAYNINYSNYNNSPSTSFLHSVMKTNSPSLDFFYQLKMPGNQSVTLNVVGAIINSLYDRTYKEYKDEGTGTEFAYKTDGNRYSFISEGLYEKEYNSYKLTSGLRYSRSYTENIYTGSTNTVTKLNNSNLYIFIQLQGKIKKLNYLLGAGMSHSNFYESMNGNDYNFYTFRPSLSLSYSFLKNSFLRYRFYIAPVLPSLSALSNVRQDLEDFRVSVGNPELKPYRMFRNSIYYQFKKKLFTGTLSGTHDYYLNPIMGDIFREDSDGKSIFIYTFNNQKKFQRKGAVLSLSVGPVNDIVSVMIEGGVNQFFSNGNNYYHKYTNWYSGFSIQAYYKNWIFFTSVNTRENSFSGETIYMGEALNNIGLYYQVKNCRIGLSMLYPYADEWKSGNEVLSEINYSKSWTHIKENGRMLILNFQWGVNYGKKHQSGKKTMNNSDTDSGIVQ